MAPRLRWWFGAMALGCAIIAASYVPPRGMGALRFLVGGARFNWQPQKKTAVAERRAELARQWQVVEGQIQAARLRRQAEPILTVQRAAGEPQRALVFSPDSTLETRRRILTPAFDSAWQQLDLGDPKVAIVVASPGILEREDAPRSFGWWRTYLLPDSTDRTTCVVVFPTSRLDQEKPRGWVMEQRFRAGLGPCAFYARFGTPSPRVRRWLERNAFDVVESSDWSGIQRARDYDYDDDAFDASYFFGRGSPYWYATVYEMSFNTVACMAGRAPACVSGLRRGDVEGAIPLRRIAVPGVRWRTSELRLPDQPVLLANVFKQVGETAFQEFWTTSLPVDSALTIALEEPVGEWLARQKEGTDLQLRLGPVPPWTSVVLAVLVAGAMLGLAGYAVRFRQVR